MTFTDMSAGDIVKIGLRSFLIGMHNPVFHTFFVTLAWRQLYRTMPSWREFVCILLHDIGYVAQDSLDGEGNTHPELGARLCGRLFGPEYGDLCRAHSREYAERLRLPLSKLGYADKYSVLLAPDVLFLAVIRLGGEAEEYHRTTTTRKWGYPIQVRLIKRHYREWFWSNYQAYLKTGRR